MRRKDREITDQGTVYDIVERCTCCRIGFHDGAEVYIVPLSFGYEIKDDACLFYFHGAKEGRKIDLIGKNPHVGFEMDTGYHLNASDIACRYSAGFQSIIGNGVMAMVTDPEEKRRALALIMRHTAGKDGWTFGDHEVNAVAVMKMTVTKWSCKEHK